MDHRARTGNEGGFTIVETMVALMLIFGVLTGAMTLLSSSVKGVLTGQQRSVATSIAREMLERARGAEYTTIGHDFDDDTTLNTTADPELSGSPLGYNGELLVSSSVDKDTASPFYPHLHTRVVGNVTYTVWAYATEATRPTDASGQATGDPYKRVTMVVRWGNSQYGGAVDDTVRVESLIFDAQEPPDPLLVGVAEVDGGAIRLLDDPPKKIIDTRVASATLFMPFSRAEIESRFVRTGRAFARSARTELRVTDSAGLTADSPCIKTTSGSSASGLCPGVSAEVIVDNDHGSAPPLSSTASPAAAGSGTVYRSDGTAVKLLLGLANSAGAEATVDHTDGLPWSKGASSGPETFSMPFTLGAASGSWSSFSGSVTTESVADRNGTGDASTISASASVSHPAIDLLTFTTSPTKELANADGSFDALSYSGMVKVGATSIDVATAAGPLAAAPSSTAGAVSVSMFGTDDLGAGSYTSFNVTPGTGLAAPVVTTARFRVEGELVTVTARLSAAPATAESNVSGTTTYRSATTLGSWLRARIDVAVGDHAAFAYEADYGRVTVGTTYEDPA